MNTDNWIEILRILIDLLKTLIPFGAIILIVFFFKEQIKELINSGKLKISAPGVSIETANSQQKKVSDKEKKEIKALNSDLKTSNIQAKKLQELQEYTSKDKDAFYLGYHFEKTYRIIFPSQMMLLSMMKSNKNEVTIPLAEALFRRTRWSQQLNMQFQTFIGFLIRSGLIRVSTSGSDKYILTPLGETYLQYLDYNKIPLKTPANDLIIPSTK